MSAHHHQLVGDILYITENDVDTGVRRSLFVEGGITKDDTSLGRADFDGSSNMMEPVWANGMRRRSLDKLQVSKGSEIDRQILVRRSGLVDNKDFKDDIELLNSDHSFSVDRVGESSELHYSR